MRPTPSTPDRRPALFPREKLVQTGRLLLFLVMTGLMAEGCTHLSRQMTKNDCESRQHPAERTFHGKPGYKVVRDSKEQIAWIIHGGTGKDIPVFGTAVQFDPVTGKCEEVLYSPDSHNLCDDGAIRISTVGEDGYHTVVRVKNTCANPPLGDNDVVRSPSSAE